MYDPNQTLKSASGRSPVTVIGLGPMGRMLAAAFLRNGHPTTVWNRTAGKANELVRQGAAVVDTAADAIAASPLVIVCVLDYIAVNSILEHSADSLMGRTLINLTSGSPDGARQMANRAAEGGFDYLDGAIIVPAIGQPEASILYSGSEQAFLNYRRTLMSLGGTATYMGTDPGRAAAYDVALLDIFWTSMTGYIHALALAGSENIAATNLVPYARNLIGMMPDIMAEFANQVDNSYYPGIDSNLISTESVMDNIIHASKARGIDVEVLEAAKSLVRQAVDLGYGKQDFSRLAELIRRPTA